MCEFIIKSIIEVIEVIIICGFLVGFVKFLFGKKLENYKNNEIRKQKAVLIAELLAEWISWPEDTKKLNQLTIEAFFWLPKDIVMKLSKLLLHASDTPQV